MSQPLTGLRERKKLATRQEISRAALSLAMKRGLDNVLVEDIAAQAGVSPRTFNNYFSSKYEAICAFGVDRARLIGDALKSRPADEPLWDAITKAVLAQYDGPDEAPGPDALPAVRLMLGSPALRGEYLKALAATRDTLAGAIAERTGADPERDMLPEILAGAVIAASQVALRRWCQAEPPKPLRPLVRQALRQLAGAFRTIS